MEQTAAEAFSRQLLQAAGIAINGNNSWDIQVHDKRCYQRVLKQGSLGLGESYMDGWWDCERLDQFFERVIRADLENKIKSNKWLLSKLIFLKLTNPQSKKRALIVGKSHYDIGNELFSSMLDKHMNYTCAYWEDAKNLDEAQLNKLELTCQKLKLKPGMRVLDIGCGFGALAKYAAENFGVDVVGISISKEQCEYAKKNCSGLPVEIRFQDYRDVKGKFDRIVSLGMFEHVGYLNYRKYMQIAHQNLNEDGLFLLHTIGANTSNTTFDGWLNKYIFPNGMLPSIVQIAKAAESLFVMEDWHNFGVDYERTLLSWHDNFNQNWDRLKTHYDDRFHRMWNYYLLTCAGIFRARHIQLWQIVFSKNGLVGGYRAPR